MLTLTNVSKKFANVTAVKDLSFSIKKGSCTALLGPNGSGKTTTLQMIAQLLPQSQGTILFSFPPKELKSTIGFLPQFPSFYSYMTPKEYLHFMGKLSKMQTDEIKKRSEEVLEIVGLQDDCNKKIGGFSGGMKQRLGIAQAILHKPKILLLDEPVSALDPLGRREVITTLQALKNETTILFSTHILYDAEELSDYYIIMNQGQKKAEGGLEDLRKQYEEPTISIVTAENINNWLEPSQYYSIKSNPTINEVTLVCNNIEQAKSTILQQIVSKNISLSYFSVGGSSLEELFLEVIGNG